jgi:2-octaprenyl-6-methoxyphenol hydroxylase
MTEKTVAVVGGGPAGLACAALLAQEGISVTVIAPDFVADQRTTALMEPSLRLLSYIGIWPGDLQAHCAPLRQLRLIDDTGNMVSAPELQFEAHELGLDAFGWNVPQANFVPALNARCEELGVRFLRETCEGVLTSSDSITLTTKSGVEVTAILAVAADGAQSKLRTAAGISVEAWSHDQAALITQFSHSAPHRDVSIEWHKSAGPFTTVPLPGGNRSSLVWMDRPDRIAALTALNRQALAREIQLESHGVLGRISDCAASKAIPMKGLRANRLAHNRVIVIGEAAHLQPPIGAQGLNLSLRDAGHVADLVLAESDPGRADPLSRFHTARMGDVLPRQMAVGFLNGSLLGEFVPVSGLDFGQLLRVGSLGAIAAIKPLRQAVMQQGLGATGLPFAMRS